MIGGARQRGILLVRARGEAGARLRAAVAGSPDPSAHSVSRACFSRPAALHSRANFSVVGRPLQRGAQRRGGFRIRRSLHGSAARASGKALGRTRDGPSLRSHSASDFAAQFTAACESSPLAAAFRSEGDEARSALRGGYVEPVAERLLARIMVLEPALQRRIAKRARTFLGLRTPISVKSKSVASRRAAAASPPSRLAPFLTRVDPLPQSQLPSACHPHGAGGGRRLGGRP